MRAIFILNTAIQSRKKRRKQLYTSFVDFSKAFDTVDHRLLWSKLALLRPKFHNAKHSPEYVWASLFQSHS